MFCGVVHPMHLFRFCERCRFEENIPDDVLVEVLEEVHDYNENWDENSSEEEEGKSKRRKKTLTEKAEWMREEENLYLEEEILELFRGRLNQVGVEEDEDCNEGRVDLKFCNLKDDRDMMRCILEFIGHAKTIINFACACRLTSEVFKQANANNELVKRLARDLGLIVFVLPSNYQRITSGKPTFHKRKC